MADSSEAGTEQRAGGPAPGRGGAERELLARGEGATLRRGDDEAPPRGDERTLAAPEAAAPAMSTARLATLAARLPSVGREVYTLGGEVAQGGIGRVLRARDERLDRPAAIKERLAWDPRQERRFVREALLTARLQHPAIVPFTRRGAGRTASRFMR